MKSLLTFTEQQLEQMTGRRLHSLNQKYSTYPGFYEAVAKEIIDSNTFFEWVQETFEDTDDEELEHQLEFTLRRIILRYIKTHFKGLIDDQIYDYLDFQDLRKDPNKYYQAPLIHKS